MTNQIGFSHAWTHCGLQFCNAPIGPLQNIWPLTNPRQFGILQTRSWLAGRDAIDLLKRREFITRVGSAAVAWPLAARARDAARRITGETLLSTAACL
jgi:hypothetical protein